MVVGQNKVTLKEWLGRDNRSLDDKLQAAIAITEMVYSLHIQQEIIGTLSPDNIIVEADATVVRIAEVGQRNDAYRAPEQTGRIQSVPDRRSDLYTLGVIFYEMFTGLLPFQRQGDEDWSYVHLAVNPLHISKISPGLSTVLASVVMKLLYKNTNERFQFSYGLLYDLRQCVGRTSEVSKEHIMVIGEMDALRQFRHPKQFCSMNKELDKLEQALQQVESRETVAIVLIGEQGTGKTLLVSQFSSMAKGKGVLCIEGSCYAESQKDAYYCLRQVFSQWFEMLWTEEEATIAAAKGKLQQLMGSDLSLLTSWLPVAQYLWPESVVTYSQSQDQLLLRLERWLPDILYCMTDISGQLVVIFDNVQWVDDKTRAFLSNVVDHIKHGGLLLLMLGRLEIIENNIHNSTTVIRLNALHFDEVRRWISLLLHEDTARIRMLAKSAYALTGGNGGALRLLLDQWYSEQKLSYNEERHEWMWDVELLGLRESDQAAQSRLWEEGSKRLTEAERHIVSIAAIIGQDFELSTVADVCQLSKDQVFDMLNAVEREGWICVVEQDEKIINYLFLDEHVRRALYEEQTNDVASWHLKIGRSLQRHAIHRTEDQQAPSYMDHLILGSSEMLDHERYQLVLDNVELGKKYYEGYQYAEAKRYFDFVVSQFQDLDADNEPFLYQTWLYLAVCEHLCGDIAGSKRRYEVLANYVDRLDPIDRARFYRYQINYFTFINDELAVEYGKTALEVFGWNMPEKSSKLSLVKEILLTQKELSRVHSRRKTFVHNEDPEYIELCQTILVIMFPLLKTDPALILILFAKFIRYGLKRGINGSLLCIIGGYEMIIQRTIPKLVDLMPTRALYTLQISSYVSLPVQEYRVTYVVALYKQLDHYDETASYLQKAMRRSMRHGDSVFTSLALTTFIVTYNGKLQLLEDQLDVMESDQRYVIDLKMASFIQLVKQYCQSMQDVDVLSQFIKIPEGEDPAVNDNYMCIAKLEAAYLAGYYHEALFWAQEGRKQEFNEDWIRNRKLRVYEALAYAASYAQATYSEKADIVKLLKKRIHRMRKWNGYYGTGSAMHVLIQAESLKVTGKLKEAHAKFEAAVLQAKSEKHGLVEGITCERLAVYYEETGSEAGSTVSLLDACTAYSDWGISAKVDMLKDNHPHLWWYLPKQKTGNNGSNEQQAFDHVEKNPTNSNWDQDKEEHWLQEITDWSVRYDRDILEQFLQITLRQVGGGRGYILRYANNKLHVEACSDRNQSNTEQADYAVSVVRKVQVSQSPILINSSYLLHATNDTYIEGNGLSSIMAIPIQLPSEQEPLILYIENRNLSSAFDEKSLNVVALMITRLVYLILLQNKGIGKSDEELKSSSVEIETLLEPLSHRELEVLITIAEGMSNKEIAASLNISETTVKKHTSNIYGKLQVKRRGQAIAKARQLHLIS
ncbi:helix-turn-helix transcriptional regulator [Paenibacillus sinopodophylli]|uniref:helix-turn-helix transcriptional regulator n=1 Tax=Paenibacillus sinopodophylli TaxID=1837342 RepID=UPI00110D0D66|nr:LuxR C-terminal-related transcriptional regulator [Paenibacillus sinopodophylli]